MLFGVLLRSYPHDFGPILDRYDEMLARTPYTRQQRQRLRLARQRVDQGESLPPLGPPLIAGDVVPFRIQRVMQVAGEYIARERAAEGGAAPAAAAAVTRGLAYEMQDMGRIFGEQGAGPSTSGGSALQALGSSDVNRLGPNVARGGADRGGAGRGGGRGAGRDHRGGGRGGRGQGGRGQGGRGQGGRGQGGRGQGGRGQGGAAQ
jgi:hypothetical protein